MSKWVKEGLDKLTTEELCARLRGQYGNITYGMVPLQEGAAKRLETLCHTLDVTLSSLPEPLRSKVMKILDEGDENI